MSPGDRTELSCEDIPKNRRYRTGLRAKSAKIPNITNFPKKMEEEEDKAASMTILTPQNYHI
jgi:hypothetical protein